MVDLLDGADLSNIISGGIIELRDGTKFYSMFVGVREDGHISVRIGKGEYAIYTRDGRLTYKNGSAYHPYDNECVMDVISFCRCAWYDQESFGLAHDYASARLEVVEARKEDGPALRAIQQ